MNGTQGFQGCPGQRGVKVKTIMLPYHLSFNLTLFATVYDQYCSLRSIDVIV